MKLSLFRRNTPSLFESVIETALTFMVPFLSFMLLGCVGNADRTAEIQAAVDRGGIVTFPAGTYVFTRTIVPHKSNTVIQGVGPETVFVFRPSPPLVNCVNDRAFTTPCDVQRTVQGNDVVWTPRRRIVGSIAIGDTSFTASDSVSDLSAGDWLIVEERDPNTSDIVVVDWAQVATASGNVITTQEPFRTAFPNARPWDPVVSGLGFLKIPQLIEDVQFRNFTLLVPDPGDNAPGISAFAAMNTVIEGVSVRDDNGQALYSYMAKGLTVTNSVSSCGGQTLNEFGATVDLTITGNSLSCDHDAGFGLDQGTGFFNIVGNEVPASQNAGVYLLYGVHDGTISGNSISFVSNSTPTYNAIGILVRGSERVIITGNDLAGGAGPASVGISIGTAFFLAVPILSQGNVVAPNTFGPGWSVNYDPTNKP